MARLLLLLFLLPCATPGPTDNSSWSAGPRNATHGLPGADSPLLRSLYVLGAFCGLAVFYFLIRACRLKRQQQRRYGLLNNMEEHTEMDSLDSEDETGFKTRNLR
uniref:Family with sequence similarity 174, member C n=2 Tax=Nannospalax galili TaxID=1026970 RepID=A0A8C6RVF8_NANGA